MKERTAKDDIQLMLVPPSITVGFEGLLRKLIGDRKFDSPVLFSIEQMMEMLAKGKMQLWTAFDPGEAPFIFMVTEVVEYPAAKTIRVCMIAGSRLRDVLHFRPKFEQWATFQGALYVEFATRPKLAKLLRRHGYVSTAIAVFKPLITIN